MPPKRDAAYLASIVEDIEWLLSFRESPDHIARRLDLKPGTISRYLYAAGRNDLAHVFDGAVDKPHAQCIECGADCGFYASRCSRCSQALPNTKRARSRENTRKEAA